MSFKEYLKDSTKRHQAIVLLTSLYNYAWGTIKILFGIFTLSFLYSLSGVDTIFVAIAKHIYLKNIGKDSKKVSLFISTFIVLIGIVYLLLAISLFFLKNQIKEYSIIIAIAIAFFSFLDLGIAIRQFIKTPKKNSIALNFRILNLSLALFAIVNTQNAIFMAKGSPNNIADGTFGVIADTLTVLASTFLLIKNLYEYKKRLS